MTIEHYDASDMQKQDLGETCHTFRVKGDTGKTRHIIKMRH